MKVGDLVRYVPAVSSKYKWEQFKGTGERPAPGILIKENERKGTTTRNFAVRWHNGSVSDEWITFLKPYDDEDE
jgi:hypothetical protein